MEKVLLYLCDAQSNFQAIPDQFQQGWIHIKLSERTDQNPDIHCQLEDLHLLNENRYDAIWLPSGLTSLKQPQLNDFLKQIYRLLREDGCFWLSTTNIKEVARLVYQTGWNEPIDQLNITPKELLYGRENQIQSPDYRSLVKNGFAVKDLAETLQQANFSKLEIIDQGLTFHIKAYRTPMLPEQKCQVLFQEYDVNKRIYQRDRLDQPTQLPVNYTP